MFLKSLYLTPGNYFARVNFVEGINYIYGYREDKTLPVDDTDSTGPNSLNNIGKSTFLDLIDFVLGSDFSSTASPRLFEAVKIPLFKKTTVHLEFEIGDKTYIASRSFEEYTLVTLLSGNTAKQYLLPEFRRHMGNLVFSRPDYVGAFDPEWYRNLLAFYIHIVTPDHKEYPHPINYLEFGGNVSMMRYHLFLLNLDNIIFEQLNTAKRQLRAQFKTQKQLARLVDDAQQVHTVVQINDKLKHLRDMKQELNEQINTYRLSKSQAVASEKANEISKKIDELNFEIAEANDQLELCLKSYKKPSSVKLIDVERMYSQISVLFASQIKHSLNEAYAFREQLIDSRKKFLESEKIRLKTLISKNNILINKLDDERAELVRMLSSSNALAKIKAATAQLNDLQGAISHLEGQLSFFDDIENRINELKRVITELKNNMLAFKNSIVSAETQIRAIFNHLYKAVFAKLPPEATFAFGLDYKAGTSYKFKIDIMENHESLGKGRNRLRTILYNLTVLLYSIEQNYNAPRFIIHDSVMDGIDKKHFVSIINLLKSPYFDGKKFQYIVTMNEEGDLLDDKFGDTSNVTHAQILKEAVLTLTPQRKLIESFK